MEKNTEFTAETNNLIMKLGHQRRLRCRFCFRSFKYQFSLIEHLKEFHKKDILKAKQAFNRSTVIQKNPNFF